MKKKILFITTQFNQGGVEKTLIEATKVLSPEKYDITLLIRLNKTDLVYLLPNYVKVIVDEDGKYQRRPKAVYYYLMKAVFSVFKNKRLAEKYNDKLKEYINECKAKNPYRKYFKGQTFDVVISYMLGLCTDMGLYIPARRRYVFHHSERVDIDREIIDRCFPLYDEIIACGYGVERVLRSSLPQFNDKITTLLNFIDIAKIIEMAKEYNPYESERKIKICTVGRICKMKGYDLAVGAAEILAGEGYSFKWYVVGDGELEKEIKDMIEEKNLEDYFVLVGNKENPYPYIAGCDVYAQTSRNEAQPLATMEAVSLGKAVVSTATTGGRAVLEDGEKGLLVAITPEGIAEGIKKFIENPEYKRSFERPCDMEYAEKNRLRYKNDWENLLSL